MCPAPTASDVASRREIRAAGELLGAALGGTSTFVGELHAAIAGRPFRGVGIAAAPVRGAAGRRYRLITLSLPA
jgi:hypothetical protein